MSTSGSKEANAGHLHGSHLARVLPGAREMLCRCLLKPKARKNGLALQRQIKPNSQVFGSQIPNRASIGFGEFTLNMSGRFPRIAIVCFFLIFLIFQRFVFLLVLLKELYPKF